MMALAATAAVAATPYDAPRTIKREHRLRPAEDKHLALPPGPLHIIISLNKQRATLFAGGVRVSESRISSGTPDHPTPMGVFTVIQKSRHHVSNLYDAPMPYMQRITWSGSALHEGPLPGRPASHGCVRLTGDFAKLLWRATKIGARVIITRDEVAPAPIESDRLFVRKAQPEPGPQAEPTPESQAATPVKTANAAGTASIATDAIPTLDELPARLLIHRDGLVDGLSEPVVTFSRRVSAPARAPIAAAAPVPNVIAPERPMPPIRGASRKPVSVFVSLKERKLYVRQGWRPLFDAPIAIEHPEQPIGTHIYTAMAVNPESNGLRWSVVSIPSTFKRAAGMPAPSSASAALDRIAIPPDLEERIAALVVPGSSLIVSDNQLSSETGETTDFIVLTP